MLVYSLLNTPFPLKLRTLQFSLLKVRPKVSQNKKVAKLATAHTLETFSNKKNYRLITRHATVANKTFGRNKATAFDASNNVEPVVITSSTNSIESPW